MSDPRVAIVSRWITDPHGGSYTDLLSQLDAAMQSPEVVSRVAQAIREAMGNWTSNEDPSVVCAKAALAAAVGGTKP